MGGGASLIVWARAGDPPYFSSSRCSRQEIDRLPDDRARFRSVVQNVEIMLAFGVMDVSQRDAQGHRLSDEMIRRLPNFGMALFADADDE